MIKKHKNQNFFSPILIIGVLMSLFFFSSYKSNQRGTPIDEGQLKSMLYKGEVEQVILVKNRGFVKVIPKSNQNANPLSFESIILYRISTYRKDYYTLEIADAYIFDNHYQEIQRSLPPARRMAYIIQKESNFFGEVAGWISYLLILLLIILLLNFLTRRLIGDGTRDLFGINKSKAIAWGEERKIDITLRDVAGLEEEKNAIKDVVEYLKNPTRVNELGGRLPKGILLEGPPGTGKTLLARAVAGEANVPFFSVSGADFIEVFVGVGSARIHDLFEKAKQVAPCIIFIDEIDAIGGSRNKHRIGGNEERENTLTKLLHQMDGFEKNDNIVVIAATNRAEVLDKALKRPGRFDTQISVGRPSMKEREEIFAYHMKAKKLKMNQKISAKQLATQTAGFSGADIENTCNQAALIAARKKKKKIEMEDFQEAIDISIGGIEKRSRVLSPKEKEIVAWHEAGHAVASWFLEHCDPLVKVSIIPRGSGTLGYAQYMPTERYISQREEFYDEMCSLLAARAAEQINFDTISTGAVSDLQRATRMAYNFIKMYGMNPKLGNISFLDHSDSEYAYYDKPYSADTNTLIDNEARALLEKQYQRGLDLLKKKKKELEKVALALLENEELYTDDMVELLGKRPFPEPTPPKPKKQESA